VEQLFSEALVDKPYDEAEEKLREDARRELWAAQLAREPLVRQAREVAEELGLLESPDHHHVSGCQEKALDGLLLGVPYLGRAESTCLVVRTATPAAVNSRLLLAAEESHAHHLLCASPQVALEQLGTDTHTLCAPRGWRARHRRAGWPISRPGDQSVKGVMSEPKAPRLVTQVASNNESCIPAATGVGVSWIG
jgi:hypothetical protein